MSQVQSPGPTETKQMWQDSHSALPASQIQDLRLQWKHSQALRKQQANENRSPSLGVTTRRAKSVGSAPPPAPSPGRRLWAPPGMTAPTPLMSVSLRPAHPTHTRCPLRQSNPPGDCTRGAGVSLWERGYVAAFSLRPGLSSAQHTRGTS